MPDDTDRISKSLFFRAGKYRYVMTRGMVLMNLVITFLNTCVIWFGLVPWVRDMFGELYWFIIIFLPFYVISMLVVGYFELRRMWPGAASVSAVYTPNVVSVMRMWRRFGELLGDEEIIKEADKWIIEKDE